MGLIANGRRGFLLLATAGVLLAAQRCGAAGDYTFLVPYKVMSGRKGCFRRRCVVATDELVVNSGNICTLEVRGGKALCGGEIKGFSSSTPFHSGAVAIVSKNPTEVVVKYFKGTPPKHAAAVILGDAVNKAWYGKTIRVDVSGDDEANSGEHAESGLLSTVRLELKNNARLLGPYVNDPATFTIYGRKLSDRSVVIPLEVTANQGLVAPQKVAKSAETAAAQSKTLALSFHSDGTHDLAATAARKGRGVALLMQRDGSIRQKIYSMGRRQIDPETNPRVLALIVPAEGHKLTLNVRRTEATIFDASAKSHGLVFDLGTTPVVKRTNKARSRSGSDTSVTSMGSGGSGGGSGGGGGDDAATDDLRSQDGDGPPKSIMRHSTSSLSVKSESAPPAASLEMQQRRRTSDTDISGREPVSVEDLRQPLQTGTSRLSEESEVD